MRLSSISGGAHHTQLSAAIGRRSARHGERINGLLHRRPDAADLCRGPFDAVIERDFAAVQAGCQPTALDRRHAPGLARLAGEPGIAGTAWPGTLSSRTNGPTRLRRPPRSSR
jgi:hypothetical protein